MYVCMYALQTLLLTCGDVFYVQSCVLSAFIKRIWMSKQKTVPIMCQLYLQYSNSCNICCQWPSKFFILINMQWYMHSAPTSDVQLCYVQYTLLSSTCLQWCYCCISLQLFKSSNLSSCSVTLFSSAFFLWQAVTCHGLGSKVSWCYHSTFSANSSAEAVYLPNPRSWRPQLHALWRSYV